MPLDAEYDENVGNAKSPDVKVSMARTEEFFLATEKALAWKPPADGDATRAVLPLVQLESLFRRAPLAKPPVEQVVPLSRLLASVCGGSAVERLHAKGQHV